MKALVRALTDERLPFSNSPSVTGDLVTFGTPNGRRLTVSNTREGSAYLILHFDGSTVTRVGDGSTLADTLVTIRSFLDHDRPKGSLHPSRP